MTAKVLVVEDDLAAAQYLALALAEEDHEVRTVANGFEALLAIEENEPDLVISDLHMPEMDGMGLLSRIKQRWPELPVILLTCEQDVATVVEAVQRGAVNYLVKPVPVSGLLVAVSRALSASPERATGRLEFPEIAGKSRAIVEMRHLVSVAARSDVNVLLSGETGTGKELAARAIHRCSKLAEGPWVAHNCAAIPPDLFESQFFGYRRGAFTGADRDHVGLLDRADGGVLFLDELETMSPLHQAKLLRVLDDGEVRPVGSSDAHRVSVRFLAATNREPQSLIRQRVLREDLYYRLRGLEIRLPPLKDRVEDIPLLVGGFLGSRRQAPTPEAMATLCALPWPGNVRELHNAIRSAEALAGGERIGPQHLVMAPLEEARAASAKPGPTRGTLKDVERDAIAQALRECGGNRTRAARQLGIDRSTLRRKITELEIDAGHSDA